VTPSRLCAGAQHQCCQKCGRELRSWGCASQYSLYSASPSQEVSIIPDTHLVLVGV